MTIHDRTQDIIHKDGSADYTRLDEFLDGRAPMASPTFTGTVTLPITNITGAATLAAAVAMTGDITPAQITADQNDYDPTGLSTASTLRLDSSATWTITGLAGGSDGRIIFIHNVGSNDINFADQSASSTAANRLDFAGNTLALSPAKSAAIQYDSTSSRWRLIGHGTMQASSGTMEAAASTAHYSTPGQQNRHPLHPKAWGEFNGNSTTILASAGITSIADTATGQMTVTLTTAMSSENWGCFPSRAEDDLTLAYSVTYDAKTASTVVLNSVVEAGDGSDPSSSSGNASWSLLCMGDHA